MLAPAGSSLREDLHPLALGGMFHLQKLTPASGLNGFAQFIRVNAGAFIAETGVHLQADIHRNQRRGAGGDGGPGASCMRKASSNRAPSSTVIRPSATMGRMRKRSSLLAMVYSAERLRLRLRMGFRIVARRRMGRKPAASQAAMASGW